MLPRDNGDKALNTSLPRLLGFIMEAQNERLSRLESKKVVKIWVSSYFQLVSIHSCDKKNGIGPALLRVPQQVL